MGYESSIRYVQQFLDADGDGNGAVPTNADYSAATGVPTFFHYQAPESKTFVCDRLIITVSDIWSSNFDPQDYGAILGGLPVGMEVQGRELNDDVIQHLGHTERFPIKSLMDWRKRCYDMDPYESTGQNPDWMTYRWTFSSHGLPIILTKQRKLGVLFQDNFSAGVTKTELMVEGMEYPEGISFKNIFDIIRRTS